MPPRKERISLVCAECGIEVKRLQCQIKRITYCSKVCVDKSKQHGSSLHCFFCDNSFYRRYGEQDIGKTEKPFCSISCYKEYRALNRKDTTYLKIGKRHAHRVIVEAIIGRILTSDEVIHHIDGNCHNNHPDNLALLPNQSVHVKCHSGGINDNELRKFLIV